MIHQLLLHLLSYRACQRDAGVEDAEATRCSAAATPSSCPQYQSLQRGIRCRSARKLVFVIGLILYTLAGVLFPHHAGRPPTLFFAEATSVRYGGSVFSGITDVAPPSGWHTFTIQVAVPVFPENNKKAVRRTLVDVLTSNVRVLDDKGNVLNDTTAMIAVPEEILPGTVDAEFSDWREVVQAIMRQTPVEVHDGGRTVKVWFRNASLGLRPHTAVLVIPCLPFSLFEHVDDFGVAELPLRCLAGDPFLVSKGQLPRVDAARWGEMQKQQRVTGNPVDVPLLGLSSDPHGKYLVERGLRVREGYSCVHTREAYVRGSSWDPESSVYRYTPYRGGVQTLCYTPFPDTVPLLRLRVTESFEVSGPEGVSTEPPLIRSEMEFTGTIYGTNLTERDTAVITDELCSNFASQDVFFVELLFSSPSRVGFFGAFHKPGMYHVCYHHEDSSAYVRVSTIAVERNSEVLIEKDSANVLVDQDVKLLESASISRLRVMPRGNLELRQRSLNVSSFVWTGGTITGKGSINCTGYSKITTHGYEARVLSVPLYNFGEMTIDVQRLMLDGDGAIHNYGNLTIAVSPMGTDGISSLLSQGRANAITNYDTGVIRIIALDERSQVLLTARLVGAGGKTVLSGRMSVTDVWNAPESTVVFKRGAVVAARNTRLSGNVELEEQSELTMLDGSVFVSATVSGAGTVLIRGDGVLIDSLAMEGSVQMRIGASVPDRGSLSVSVYGTSTFGANTLVAIAHADFVTSTGLAKLLFAGDGMVEFGTTSFAGNMVLQLSGRGVLYGNGLPKSVDHRAAQGSLASLFVPPNATLFVVDTEPQQGPGTPTDHCGVFFAVQEYLALGGRMLLRGCCAFPLGGSISGSLQTLTRQSDWDVLLHLLCLRGGLSEPLCMTGDHLPTIYSGVSFNDNVHVRGDTNIALDELVVASGTMRAADPVRMALKGHLVVRKGARLQLNGGGHIAAGVMEVDGVLELREPQATEIAAEVKVGEEGLVRVFSPRSPCIDEVKLTGGNQLHMASELSVECVLTEAKAIVHVPRTPEMPLTPDMYIPDLELRRRTLGAMPLNVSCSREMMEDTLARLRLMPASGANWVYSPRPGVPSARDSILTVAVAVVLVFLALNVLLHNYGITLRQFWKDLFFQPPLHLTLEWSEFNYRSVNYVVLCVATANNLHKCVASFHPGMPGPLPTIALLCERTTNLVMHHLHPNALRLTTTLSVLLVLYGILNIVINRRMGSHFLRRNLKQLKFSMSFAEHTISIVNCLLVMFHGPLMSAVMDGITCPTLLHDVPTCKPFKRVDTFVLSALALLVISLVPPWNYAAHQTEITGVDVRVKVAWAFCLSPLLTLEILMWKVSYSSPLLMVLSSLFFQLTRGVIGYFASPTAFGNINRFLRAVGALCCVCYASILIQLARARMGLLRSCTDGEMTFKVGFLIIIVGMIVAFVRVVFLSRASNDSVGDVSIDAIRHSIEQLRQRILDMRLEAMTSAEGNERDAVLNGMARLRMELFEKQERYRYEVNRFLRPFFLGSKYTGTETIDGTSNNSYPHRNNRDASQLYASDSSYLSAPSSQHSGDLLTIDEMENFSCGPTLGKGSYGTVHMGILSTGKLVAVKYVSVASDNVDALNAVKAEVDMLRELSHPNIIRYYGAHMIGDTMLVFMEFAVGGSLTSILRKFSALTEPVMQLYTYQILRGLQYLHAKGVVHRDIKGDNILIDGYGVAKLADFGCSKALANIANASQAGCGTLVGSPFWMAPEVIRSEAYGTKADIWSVGCTVVEMLNGGEPPWRDEFDNVYSAMYYVGSTTNIPRIPEETSELCEDFLKRCFERDVTKRASADELLQHLWLQNVAKITRTESWMEYAPITSPTYSSPVAGQGSRGSEVSTGESTIGRLIRQRTSSMFAGGSEGPCEPQAGAEPPGPDQVTHTASPASDVLDSVLSPAEGKGL